GFSNLTDFALIMCPDLESVANHLVQHGADHVAYTSPAGPIFLAREFALRPGTRLVAQRPLQTAFHEASLGPVHGRAAHDDAPCDLLVAASGIGGQQGQYLAFIHLYTRLHRRPPAETDMQEYFRVSPPSIHQMVLTLERTGLIRRQPRTPRSIEVLVDPKHLPELV